MRETPGQRYKRGTRRCSRRHNGASEQRSNERGERWSAAFERSTLWKTRSEDDDEARIAAIRELVYRLRVEAGLTQAELAERMVTTQSAIARMEGGGTRPTLETLEKVATAVGAELVVGVGEHLSENRSIAKLVREGRAVVRKAS